MVCHELPINILRLGVRQDVIYLPLGLIVMSYLRSARERSNRASYGLISFFDRRMPLPQSPASRLTVGRRPKSIPRLIRARSVSEGKSIPR